MNHLFYFNLIFLSNLLIALHSKCRPIIIISIAPKWTRLLNQDILTNY